MAGKVHRLILFGILFLICGQPVTAQATIADSNTTRPVLAHSAGTFDTDRPALQHRNPRYRLCASDVIALTFPLTLEFDQTVSVQPDGFATLAGAGDIHLEGLTEQEAIPAIRTAYAEILHNPIVTIELKDFNKPYFTVSGQVFKPGKFDLRGYTTATEAIAMAGGFEDSAKHSQVLLFRRVKDSWLEVKNLDLKHILQGHSVNEDPQIRPGDMLFVPQNTISKAKKFIPNYGMGAYSEFHP
jgi:polysaccharide export outer membrane protein